MAVLTYSRNDVIAVHGEGNQIWLCKYLQKARNTKSHFKCVWFERNQCGDYTLESEPNLVPYDSIIKKVRLVKSNGAYKLPLKTSLQLEKLLPTEDEKHEDETKTGRKRKLAKDKQTKNSGGKGKKTKLCAPPDAKKTKVEKAKVDKSNPNWRLKPRPKINVWSKDPLFETTEEVPFVSPSAHSHLVTRAVFLNDVALLKKCINDRKNISSVSRRRSIMTALTPLHYAIQSGNLAAIKLLKSEMKPKAQMRVEETRCHLQVVSTGHYNYRSLGIRHIRRLQMSRGSREGNNAFTKDATSDFYPCSFQSYLYYAAEQNADLAILRELNEEKSKNCFDSRIIVNAAVRGHRRLAAALVKQVMDFSKMESPYSKFHLESLTKTSKDPDWNPSIKEASITKKADMGMTPMHLACINPCTKALDEIYNGYPNLHLADQAGRKPVHYAAVCEGTGPLEYLQGKGVYLLDSTKQGLTPIHSACVAGRADNIKFIYDHIKAALSNDDEASAATQKFGIAGINMPQRNSWCPLHLAIGENHLEVVELLLDLGANVEKPLSSNCDKLTPLMLASASGNLEMVKLLVTKGKAKVEKMDKYRKTALTHAVMNGNANVASYLVHLGAAFNTPDSSLNTNLHYACAYGWYFCAKLLLEAGADPNAANEWKLTPVAVAFLKGHSGLAKWLLEIPGVDINGRDDNERTVIMTMIVEAFAERSNAASVDNDSRGLSKQLLEEICDMIDRRNADPTVADKFKRNILHYLAGWNSCEVDDSFFEGTQKQISAKQNHRIQMQLKFVEKFLDYKCNLWTADEDGDWPLAKVFRIKVNHGRNYPLIDLILSSMSASAANDEVGKLVIPKDKNTILEAFSSNVSLAYVEKELEIFKKLVQVLKMLEKKGSLDIRELMAARNGSMSAFLTLCRTYSCFPKIVRPSKPEQPIRFLPSLNYDKCSLLLVDYDKKWSLARDIITMFIKEFNPTMAYTHSPRKGCKPLTISASLAILGMESSNEPEVNNMRPGFQLMLQFCKEVDCVDINGNTQLVKAVIRGHIKQSRNLLAAGANPSLIYESEKVKTCYVNGQPLAYKLKSFPLLEAIRSGKHSLVKLLLEHGATLQPKGCESKLPNGTKFTPNPFLLAVALSRRARFDRARLAIVKDIIHAGANIASVVQESDKKKGMSALHLAVYGSSGRADESLDLELVLIKSGANVFAECNGRYPLHDLFRDGSVSPATKDPIEVCSLLVEAMQEDKIDKTDDQGRSPLHYAAFCGGTISCLLLLSRGADINRVDMYGNTPLAYSVAGCQDSCSLMLIQKGANVNVTINFDWRSDSKQSKNKEEIFKYLPRHFETAKGSTNEVSLFKSLVQNDWLGITFVAMEQMEKFGMSYASLIEVAFSLKKLQFAKRLIEKQVSAFKLKQKVTASRNLVTSLAFENSNEGQDKMLLHDVLDLLIESGIELIQADEYGCTALHYACLHRNQDLFEYLLKNIVPSKMTALSNLQDKYGRTPLLCMLWKCDHGPDLSMVKTLIEKGADVNHKIQLKPLSHFRGGFTAKSLECGFHDEPWHDISKVTPLIIGVVFKNAHLVELLLEMNADVDACDTDGMTALMHAAKANDVAAAKLLINYGANVFHFDCHGHGAVNHAISSQYCEDVGNFTYDNESMIAALTDAFIGANPDLAKSNAAVWYREAVQSRAIRIANYISTRFGLNRKVDEQSIYAEITFEGETALNRIKDYDVAADARKMVKKLESDADKASHVEGPQFGAPMDIDSDEEDTIENSDGGSESSSGDESVGDEELKEVDESKPPSQCNVKDGELYMNYSILMTKIDVSQGAWGLYNFYRMQIWKEKHKDLYVLFTNWGRIGSHWWGSQCQNTPYGSADQAAQEFEKIFKAKSGNEWSQKDSNFECKKGKYRLVDPKKMGRVKKSALVFDLRSDKPSSLSSDVQLMMKDMANVSMYMNAYKKVGIDFSVVPFGRIKRDDLKKAQELLNQLEGLAKENEKITKRKNDPKNKATNLDDELHNVLSKISDLSTEYYYLMPKQGFEFTRLEPLDSAEKIQVERDILDRMLDFEIAERILLGAQYRKDEINPIDYIFKAIGCQIECIAKDDSAIAPHILKYIYNSNGFAGKNVTAIYKVSIKADQEKLQPKQGMWKTTKAMNRKLLWHGTKLENLISILNKGLLLNYSFANVSGRLYGEGIYAADVLDKSFSYSSSMVNTDNYDGRYFLLCDVALGNTFKMAEHRYLPNDKKNFDSIQAVGRYQPDPEESVRPSCLGIVVPNGRIKHTKGKSIGTYNEFVAAKSDQVAVRYIVRVSDAL